MVCYLRNKKENKVNNIMNKKTNQSETVDVENINAEETITSTTQEGAADASQEQECDNVSDSCESASDKEAGLAEEAALWRDKYARLSAEFDNYRKRTLKEKMDLIEGASEGVVKSLLSVVDDFDRASAALAKSDDINSAKEGMALIHKRLLEVLKQQSVTEIEALGSDLDTDFHDAIANFPVEDDQKKGKIIDVVEKGYMMKDKVIRFAKVVVGE